MVEEHVLLQLGLPSAVIDLSHVPGYGACLVGDGLLMCALRANSEQELEQAVAALKAGLIVEYRAG